MNKVEIIRTFDKADVLPFEHFLIGNVEIDDKTKEEIVRLIAMGVLKSSDPMKVLTEPMFKKL